MFAPWFPSEFPYAPYRSWFELIQVLAVHDNFVPRAQDTTQQGVCCKGLSMFC